MAKQGLLPAEVRTFAMHPDVAQYCEWFCPGEKIFLDTRLTLFQAAIPEFERLCLALNPSLQRQGSGAMPSPADAEGILSTYKIGCLLLYDPDLRVLAPALHRINQSTHEWDLLAIAGRVVFAGYKQAETRRCPHFDPERMAFAPEEPDKHASASLSVPLTQARSWWDYYLQRPSGSTWEADSAPVYLYQFEDNVVGQLQRQRIRVLARYSAGLVGLPALFRDDVGTLVGIASRLAGKDLFQSDLLERPAALPLLAVRADRQALAIHPDDSSAWLSLRKDTWLLRGRRLRPMFHFHLSLKFVTSRPSPRWSSR